MGDISDPRLLYAKGALFLVLGLLCAGLLIWDRPEPLPIVLLVVAIWSFARAYYFAFYVIEHYIDGEYEFAGLTSFVVYLLRRPAEEEG